MFVEIEHGCDHELINIDEIESITERKDTDCDNDEINKTEVTYVEIYMRHGSICIDFAHNYEWWKQLLMYDIVPLEDALPEEDTEKYYITPLISKEQLAGEKTNV